jgi:small subunit ribosomal protein S6
MPQRATLYDLVMLLSTNAEDEQRAKILADVEAQISVGAGAIERNDHWGRRPLAYEISHQQEADAHLLQFTGPPALLDSLSHSLRINDGVLRFRITKVVPGTPPAPDSAPPVVAPALTAPVAPVPEEITR